MVKCTTDNGKSISWMYSLIKLFILAQCCLLCWKLRKFMKFCNDNLALDMYILICLADFIFAYSELSEKILFSGNMRANSRSRTLALDVVTVSPYFLMGTCVWIMSAELNKLVYGALQSKI